LAYIRQRGRGGFGRPYPIGIASACCALAVALVPVQASAASGRYLLKSQLQRTASTVGARRATGAFSGHLKIAGTNSTFTWSLRFRYLSGAALYAGIYFGKAAKPSQLAMLLCTKCISGANSYYRGAYVASPTFVRAIRDRRAYVVIQTRKNPKGEIRGLIKAQAG
jgi:CHRD domain-containing protein